MATIQLKTAIPGPKGKELLAEWHNYEYDSVGFQASVVWADGKRCSVTDVDGNVFLDWTSGVLVTNVGHCHPHLVKAVQDAAGHLLNNYECANPWRIAAAKKLVGALPKHMDTCFFMSTGSEATEAATRVMKRKTGRFEIVGFHGGFHGRTSAAAAAGGLQGPKKKYGPTLPGMIRVPYPYMYRCPFGSTSEQECADKHMQLIEDTVRANTTGSLAGLIVEPYLGAAGFIFPPANFLQMVEKWARANDMLFTIDEVQASYGRCGTQWAHTLYGITPDLMAVGKGIGSGIPVSALCGRREVFSCLSKGEMSSTAGGNPVSSAAVTAVLEIMEKEKLAENANRIGAIIMKRLKAMQDKSPFLGDVRGRGLIMGMELVKDKNCLLYTSRRG